MTPKLTERERFEAWIYTESTYTKQRVDAVFRRNTWNTAYENDIIEAAWQGWKARSELENDDE